jgi:hypothetical protein
MKKKKPRKDELIELLREFSGNMAAGGRRLHVDRRTVWCWVNAVPELQQIVEDETETFIDTPENIFRQVSFNV